MRSTRLNTSSPMSFRLMFTPRIHIQSNIACLSFAPLIHTFIHTQSDVSRLVRLFERCGDRDLRFVVQSGLWLGGMLGVFQSLLYMVQPRRG